MIRKIKHLKEIADSNPNIEMGAALLSMNEIQYLPEQSGIYIVFDNSQYIYIGKAHNFLRRWQRHHKEETINRYYPKAKIMLLYCSKEDAIEIETELIRSLKPVLNLEIAGRSTYISFRADPIILKQINELSKMYLLDRVETILKVIQEAHENVVKQPAPLPYETLTAQD